jgi:hypothetical protein
LLLLLPPWLSAQLPSPKIAAVVQVQSKVLLAADAQLLKWMLPDFGRTTAQTVAALIQAAVQAAELQAVACLADANLVESFAVDSVACDRNLAVADVAADATLVAIAVELTQAPSALAAVDVTLVAIAVAAENFVAS